MSHIISFTLITLSIILIPINFIRHMKLNSRFKQFSNYLNFSPISIILINHIMTLSFCSSFFLVLFILYNMLAEGHNKCFQMLSFVFFSTAIFMSLVIFLFEKVFIAFTQLNLETVSMLINIVEFRDKYTRGHSEHVSNLVEILYSELPADKKKKIDLPSLKTAALLHDIGKIIIPLEILNNKNKLTKKEIDLIKEHVNLGRNIMRSVKKFQNISDWIYYHHERIDGRGYKGLKGDEIPFESQLIAVADTFSAITCDRAYRKRKSYEEAIEIVKEVSGTQLDAELVEIFVNIDKEKIISLTEQANGRIYNKKALKDKELSLNYQTEGNGNLNF